MKLGVFLPEELIKILVSNTFKVISESKGHVKLRKDGVRRPVVVPNHPGRTIKKGTLSAIISQSQKPRKEFC